MSDEPIIKQIRISKKTIGGIPNPTESDDVRRLSYLKMALDHIQSVKGDMILEIRFLDYLSGDANYIIYKIKDILRWQELEEEKEEKPHKGKKYIFRIVRLKKPAWQID
jgi:hypothetical protein